VPVDYRDDVLYGFVLEDIVRWRVRPVKGALGFFEPEF
jgi:hypothetical protein